MADTTKPEIVQLIRRINEGATNSQTPLGEELRLCLRLGKLLNNRELSNWAKAEAGGYESRNNLPASRIFETGALGRVSRSYRRGREHAPTPKYHIAYD